MKKLFHWLVITLLFGGVSACTAYKPIGSGTVLDEKLVSKADLTHEVKTGAYTGAATGSLAGAVYGAGLGAICVLISSGACSSIIPGFAAAGALIGAGVGGVTGAVTGFGYGTYRQGKGFYHYKVQQCSPGRGEVKIEQFSSSLMPAGTTVTIYQKGKGQEARFRISPSGKEESTCSHTP